MPNKAPTTNVTVFVDRLYDFEFRGGRVTWLSDENRTTECRSMPLSGFRKAYLAMGKLLAEIGDGRIIRLPSRKDR